MTREYVTIPKEAWDFLCGQGELDGVSFGERHPTRFGLYWWRSYIAALTAPAPAPDDEALMKMFGDTLYRFRKEPSSQNYDEMRAADEALRRRIAELRARVAELEEKK